MNTVYRDHTISLTDNNFLFSVDGEHLSQTFSGYREATVAIDRAIEAAAKQRNAAEKLEIPVLDEEGNLALVRGIHSGTGAVLGLLKYGYSPSDMYANLPWLAALLKEKHSLKTRINQITERVNPYKIRFISIGRVKPEDYERQIKKLVSAIKQAEEAAAASAPKEDALP